MNKNPLPRLDQSEALRSQLLPYCRLAPGEIWEDEVNGHRVGCLDVSDSVAIASLMGKERAALAIHDPPYNVAAFEIKQVSEFVEWCNQWISLTYNVLSKDASLYIWIGADQNDGFQPLPDFMIMMRGQRFSPRSFITMRNQRGYGTQKNWMAVRQELLYYVKGNPDFQVEYTDIPKVLKGYYKKVDGKVTENLQRSKSEHIRASNVWVDIQQVFYRMEENVSGCYAQKPLKSIERIIRASSNANDLVIDYFSHSGTTLLASEILDRKCYTVDIDPVFAEITIRRLENFRKTGRTGWQNGNPFEGELRELGAQNAQLDIDNAPEAVEMPVQNTLM
ncbi:MAG: site-specific DNA-methyltransferase [Chloroflexota bacterium]|nr:site-specific DNA-methyltransferase [Chloroflexota bacterium]MDE2946119.1 site-specific DNA-methyltransferase [Chloroflexota bacterium]